MRKQLHRENSNLPSHMSLSLLLGKVSSVGCKPRRLHVYVRAEMSTLALSLSLSLSRMAAWVSLYSAVAGQGPLHDLLERLEVQQREQLISHHFTTSVRKIFDPDDMCKASQQRRPLQIAEGPAVGPVRKASKLKHQKQRKHNVEE